MSTNSIRQQKEDYDRFKILGLMTPNGNKLLGAVEDMCRELYNKGSEIITAENIHPVRDRMYFFGKPPSYWMKFQCMPGEWLFLPHGMYKLSVPSGDQAYPITLNFGDNMFKGNTLPSRPEASKVRSFVPGVRGR